MFGLSTFKSAAFLFGKIYKNEKTILKTPCPEVSEVGVNVEKVLMVIENYEMKKYNIYTPL